MKTYLLILFMSSFLFINTSFSQCDFDNTNIGAVTFPSCPDATTVTCMMGGDEIEVNVEIGNSYIFSTCGSTTFDSQLTLYDNTGLTSLGDNDDFCGTQSQITWIATYTGVVHILLDEYNCITNTTCMDLNIDCSIPSDADSGCNTDNTICSSGVAGPFGFGTAGEDPENCQAWLSTSQFSYIPLYITQDGSLNILIEGDATTGYLDVSIYNIPSGVSPCDAFIPANLVGCNFASSSSGCNEFGTSFGCESSVPAPAVTAGQQLMIIVEDYGNGASNNYTLELAPAPAAQTGPPDATIDPVGPFCSNTAPVQLSAVNMGGDWTGSGVSSTGFFDPALAGTGNHTINYAIGLAPCNSSSSTTIIVNSTLAFTIIGTDPVACNASDGFIVISDLTPSTNHSTSYDDDGITQPAVSIMTDAFGTLTIPNLNAGTYTNFFLNSGLCSGTSSMTINLANPGAPIPSAGPPLTICSGDTGNIGINPTVDYSYSWSPSTGLSNSNEASPTITLTNLTAVPVVSSYTVTVVTPLGCSSTESVDVTVNPTPISNFTSDITNGCIPLTVTFTNSSSPNGATTLWDFGDGSNSISSAGAVTHIYTSLGCKDVTLTTTDLNCLSTLVIPQMICTTSGASAHFSVDKQSTSVFDPQFIFTNNSTDANTYRWDFGDGDSSTIANPKHEYEDISAEYTVTLIASQNDLCQDTISVILEIRDELIYYIPNSFTPDNNKFNQTFQPVFTTGFDPFKFKMIIINRWGETVFETHDASIGWDGTYGGKIASEGSYTWRIDFKDSITDKKYTKTGNITLIR